MCAIQMQLCVELKALNLTGTYSLIVVSALLYWYPIPGSVNGRNKSIPKSHCLACVASERVGVVRVVTLYLKYGMNRTLI